MTQEEREDVDGLLYAQTLARKQAEDSATRWKYFALFLLAAIIFLLVRLRT